MKTNIITIAKLLILFTSIILNSSCSTAKSPVSVEESVFQTSESEKNDIFSHADSVMYDLDIAGDCSEETVNSHNDNSEIFSLDKEHDQDFRYTPPQEVLSAHFYCDDIECEVNFSDINISQNCADEEPSDLFTDSIPVQIIDNVLRNIPNVPVFNGSDYEVTDISYMKYDFNSDDLKDYLIDAVVSNTSPDNTAINYSQYHFNRVFLSSENDYIPIEISPSSDPRTRIKYILSTQSNGLKDLFLYSNSNSPALQYDGKSSYAGAEELDERHTFLTYELLQNSILHINMKVSVIGANIGKYYTAVKFEDNPYWGNELLYTSYADGEPRCYILKSFGEWEPGDFNPSSDGYDFYIELKANALDEFDQSCLNLLEIKYISAQ